MDVTRLADLDKVEIIQNHTPKGFGANHNAVFRRCTESFFCVLNPDVELIENPFPTLLKALNDESIALAAPLIIAPDGSVEDSVRFYPTFASLLFKAFGSSDGRFAVKFNEPIQYPDWVAGMFMLFRSSVFKSLNGFDEGYFLYYEDVDICRRAWLHRMRIAVLPEVVAIHDARRDSRRSLRHMRWHLASMVYFLWRWR